MHLKVWCDGCPVSEFMNKGQPLLDTKAVELMNSHPVGIFKLYCVDCQQWLYEGAKDFTLAYSLLTRHAFHPNHAAESRARIRVARLNKEIGDFLGTITEL